jgi:hypothetical protein
MWFPPTGHTLRGAFLDYWNRYGGLAQFGYPLTEEFFEPIGADNKMHQVQYFERNRFELHPENAGTQYEVLLGALGLDFRKADSPASPMSNAQYFPETGHNLSGKFKEYWDTHGGLFVHGYPITEPVMEKSTNGKEYLVQWFERSRFELHPENLSSPYEVLLGVLGRQLSEKKGYPYGWYPSYGYAADYSWLSGWILYEHCFLERPDLFIVYERVGRTGKSFGFVSGESLKAARDLAQLHGGYHIIVFGRLAGPEDPPAVCDRKGYVVDKVQAHPSQENPLGLP